MRALATMPPPRWPAWPEDGVAFLDARPIYNGIAAPLFTDDVHFRSRQGYEILSRAIADALPADALSRPQP